MENKIKQLRKGILELAILKSLGEKKHYGYSLIKTIATDQYVSLNEGTIYPILSRLSKEDLVHTEWVESKHGPPRKYYSLSIKGKETLEVLSEEFEKLVSLIKKAKGKPGKKNDKKIIKPIKVKKEIKNE